VTSKYLKLAPGSYWFSVGFQFDNEVDTDILELVDEYRVTDQNRLRDIAAGNYTGDSDVDTSFEGHGALIVAKETVNTRTPLCMGLGPNGLKVSNLSKCHIKNNKAARSTYFLFHFEDKASSMFS